MAVEKSKDRSTIDGAKEPHQKELLDVIAVFAKPDFSLLLLFETGELRSFDMSPLLNTPPFLPLQNLSLFSKARVAYGTVTWPQNLDIAPETLYDRSAPAAHPLDSLRPLYPNVFRHRVPRSPGPFRYFGFEIFGDGWRQQIQRVCELLEAEAVRLKALNRPMPWISICDERHGELRIGSGVSLSDRLQREILQICAETRSICSVCGRAGRYSERPFGSTRCPIHMLQSDIDPQVDGAEL